MGWSEHASRVLGRAPRPGRPSARKGWREQLLFHGPKACQRGNVLAILPSHAELILPQGHADEKVGCVSQQLTRSLARRVTDSFFCRYDECLNKIWALLNVNSLPEDSWNFESLNDTNSAYTAEIVTTSDGSYEPKIVDCSFCADPSSYAASDGTTEWPDALKDLKPIMSKCTGSDQIMDDHGNTFHVCCHSSMFAPKEEKNTICIQGTVHNARNS